jgi:hypothetical protein
MIVSCVIMPCSLVRGYVVWEELVTFIIRVEDGGDKLLGKCGNPLQDSRSHISEEHNPHVSYTCDIFHVLRNSAVWKRCLIRNYIQVHSDSLLTHTQHPSPTHVCMYIPHTHAHAHECGRLMCAHRLIRRCCMQRIPTQGPSAFFFLFLLSYILGALI